MAAGDILLTLIPQAAELPATAFATFDTRNNHVVLDFDAATDESAYFKGVMPWHYGGNGVDLLLDFTCTTGDSGNVIWGAAFERLWAGDAEIASDSFATAKTVTKAVNATPDLVDRATISFANTEIDGIAAGDAFRLRIYRDADAGGDTTAGDAELLLAVLRETP